MPTRRLRSRSQRKVYVKVPGGKVSIHHRPKKPNNAKCAECGAVLSGVPRALPSKMRNISKTKKRPERPYGGYLCSKCLRASIIKKIR